MSYLITNRTGGYILLDREPFSRYSGIFFRENNKTYKVFDDIKLNEKVKELKSNFWLIDRKHKKTTQKFFMPQGFNAILYEHDNNVESEFILDCKESYDNRQYGRIYEIEEQENRIIITFTKKTDMKEDSSHDEEEYELFVVLRDHGFHYTKIDKWIKRDYPLDNERSTPQERFVYSALKVKPKKLAIAFSTDRDKAIHDADFVFNNAKNLKKIESKYYSSLLKRKKKGAISKGFNSARVALDQLLVKENSSNGIYAGLPWFFQFWARDEAISLKAVSLIGKNLTAKKTILRLMNTIQSDGNIPNRIPPTDLGCADAVGWTFKRASQLMTNFLPLEKKLIKRKLYQSINSLLKNHTEDNLAMNGPQETWMDTVYQDDYRNGARIEIQAMRLQMYQLMYKLSNQKIYRDLELRLKKRVRDLFWNDKYLADGLGDWTIRPNLFIAYYVYPQLLSKEEWKTCFKFVLKHLWLDWGGLSTIEKHHPLFHENYSGEVPESYHRGDSWFWINNLAAICLYKVDKKYFKNYIGKIIKASLKEMLELGTIGCSAELSSSNELKSQGCLSQAWSSAMFIELLKILD